MYIDGWRYRRGLVVPKKVARSINCYRLAAGKSARNIQPYGKAMIIKIWETASPVTLVWLLSANGFGELGQLSGNWLTAFLIACAACLPGCWHDARYIFGSYPRTLWDNRSSNFLGKGERTIVRGIGLLSIALNKCSAKKTRSN
jgi:hypothetical protein